MIQYKSLIINHTNTKKTKQVILCNIKKQNKLQIDIKYANTGKKREIILYFHERIELIITIKVNII